MNTWHPLPFDKRKMTRIKMQKDKRLVAPQAPRFSKHAPRRLGIGFLAPPAKLP
ncbi:hypothetical protein NOC27_676 [Nitrosococcus oceani AFC27]|nr:hypothetical protein NOC27_676 [Nitrosococcus oceani AFC27]